MILTKEQQERMVADYMKDHNTIATSGFVDGIIATINLINEVNKEPKYGKHYSFPSK